MVNESVTYTLWHFDKKVFFYSQAQDGQTLRWSVEIKGLFPPNELFVALHPPSKAFAVFQDIYPAEYVPSESPFKHDRATLTNSAR